MPPGTLPGLPGGRYVRLEPVARKKNTALLLLIPLLATARPARAAEAPNPPGYRQGEPSDGMTKTRKGRPAGKKAPPRRPDVSPSDHRRRRPVDFPRPPFAPPGPPDEFETAAV